MRNYKEETEKRIAFIRKQVEESETKGIVFGNSGGKDSALVGVLCKMACDDTVGIIMPCCSECNYADDMSDALMIANLYKIDTRKVDLTKTAEAIKKSLKGATKINETAEINLAPRLRMTALYAVANSENRLVAGTGNKSELHMGYFTKWGDGSFDFNPIADLTVTEIYEFLTYLGAPKRIISKAPSAGLYNGQTDEAEMGITYKAIDEYLQSGVANPKDLEKISRYHTITAHKRNAPIVYKE
ncbi:MAG: NAD(+) synthase [Oscillospiraceae bacterium]|jgi:NAD+ synthase|nr:NAD(+) synthase [Oscillospiraceae bacterium]